MLVQITPLMFVSVIVVALAVPPILATIFGKESHEAHTKILFGGGAIAILAAFGWVGFIMMSEVEPTITPDEMRQGFVQECVGQDWTDATISRCNAMYERKQKALANNYR